MENKISQSLDGAIGMAKQIFAQTKNMPLSIHRAAKEYGLDTAWLAQEMSKRSRDKKNCNKKDLVMRKKPYVRIPQHDWMAKWEAE